MKLKGLFKGLFTKKAEHFVLQGEGFEDIHDPSVDELSERILSLVHPGNSFLALTDRYGNYLQIKGSRPWCAIERGTAEPESYRRAYQNTPSPRFLDGTSLNCGAGAFPMTHDEWFLRKDAVPIALAFLKNEEMPASVQWRIPMEHEAIWTRLDNA
jgi:hypothetical protein